MNNSCWLCCLKGIKSSENNLRQHSEPITFEPVILKESVNSGQRWSGTQIDDSDGRLHNVQTEQSLKETLTRVTCHCEDATVNVALFAT